MSGKGYSILFACHDDMPHKDGFIVAYLVKYEFLK